METGQAAAGDGELCGEESVRIRCCHMEQVYARLVGKQQRLDREPLRETELSDPALETHKFLSALNIGLDWRTYPRD